MKLPTVKVVQRSYWTILMRDEFRPDGEEFKKFETQEEAEAAVQRLVRKQLATRETKPA